jgi:hypothetical protein
LQAGAPGFEPTGGEAVVAIQDVVCELVLEEEEIVDLVFGVRRRPEQEPAKVWPCQISLLKGGRWH